MNPEEQDESAMTPSEDVTGPSDAGSESAPENGGAPEARPGTTDVQAYIGRQLRAVYDDVVKQPIPDRFLALMKRLEEGSSGT